MLFAHSRNERDRGFFRRFARALVRFPSALAVRSSPAELFGPANDFYTVGNAREARYTGALTYRFGTRAVCANAGTLPIVDGDGHRTTLPFDLSRYR